MLIAVIILAILFAVSIINNFYLNSKNEELILINEELKADYASLNTLYNNTKKELELEKEAEKFAKTEKVAKPRTRKPKAKKD